MSYFKTRVHIEITLTTELSVKNEVKALKQIAEAEKPRVGQVEQATEHPGILLTV